MQKHHTLSLFFLFLVTLLTAQSNSTPKEVGLQLRGINFNGFTSFSAFYKKQKAENVFTRYRFIFGNIGFQVIEEAKDRFDFSAGLAIGREKRRSIGQKLIFYRGPEFSFNINAASNEFLQTVQFGNQPPIDIRRSYFGVGVGFGYVVGLQHNFNDLWAINAETIPSVNVSALLSNPSNSGSINAGLSNGVSLGIVRRF